MYPEFNPDDFELISEESAEKESFTLFKFSDEVLKQYGLPDLPCPVRAAILEQVLGGDGIQLTLLADECHLFLGHHPESKAMFSNLYARLNYIAGIIAGQSGDNAAAAMYLIRAYKIYIGKPYEAPQLVFETASKYTSALNKLNRFNDALFVFEDVFFHFGSVDESSFAFWQEAIDLNYQRGNTNRTITLLEQCIEKFPEKFPEDIRTAEESLRDKAIRYLARTYQEKCQYTGERNETGEYHGKGTLLDHTDGSKCSGEWKNGKMHGHGTISSPGKFAYVGEWKDGRHHGKGILTAADGRVFKGHWEDGHLEGWGIWTDAKGKEIYNGQWHKGNKHGKGRICDKGLVYEGEFANNKFNGRGILTVESGERFEGEFADDNFVNGVLYTPKGAVVWKNGEAVGVLDTKKEQKSDQPAIQVIDAQDRYRGVIVGLAVGDALGMPLEFLKKEEIQGRYGGIVRDYVKPKAGHLCEKLKPGQYTDDTQMALALAQSIIDKGEFSPHAFKRRLVEWYHCKDHRAPGNACIESVRRLVDGVSWKESGQKDAAGCGSAMRVAPLALVYRNAELVEHSATQSIMTHLDKRATIGSILTAAIISLILEKDSSKFDRDSLLDFMTRVANTFEDKFEHGEKEFSMILKEFPKLLMMKFDDGIKQIGTSGYVVQTFCAAFYAFLYSPNDFETTIINAVNQGNDADSIGAIAGAFSGALNGMKGIPGRWLEPLEGREELIVVADNLLKISGRLISMKTP